MPFLPFNEREQSNRRSFHRIEPRRDLIDTSSMTTFRGWQLKLVKSEGKGTKRNEMLREDEASPSSSSKRFLTSSVALNGPLVGFRWFQTLESSPEAYNSVQGLREPRAEDKSRF